jgi:hypothetical protein
MTLRACDLTAGHIGQRAEIRCDNFGATGVLVGVVGYATSRAVVLHLADSGASATCTVPWNADVTLGDPEASGIGWCEEGVA